MKIATTFVIWNLVFSACAHAEWTEENRRIEAEQAALWENQLAEVKRNPAANRPQELWLGLRNMGFRRSHDGHSPAIDAIYEKLQVELLSDPRHARRFADEIEQLRRNNKDTTMERVLYIVETLPHLPSPETIQILGRYLSDERDVPLPRLPNQDWTDLPPNSFLAADALGRIGLRDALPSKSFLFKDQAVLDAIRAWWEEVETGQRTFSFKGRKVEYRFKPDGTWETLPISNPPDDGPKTPEETTMDRPIKQALPAQVDSPGIARDSWWWWFGIGGLVLLATGAWIVRRTAMVKKK